MLIELIRYTALADEMMIEVFNSTDIDMPQAELLFSHVLNAQHIWLSRINGVKQEFERLEKHSKAVFTEFHKRNVNQLKEVLESKSLETIISYTDAAGNSFSDKLEDILFHVVNHSTYHRGQIATKFKEAGLTPPMTDYILLKRQGAF